MALVSTVQAAAEPAELLDRRAPQWKATTVRNVGTGVVQYTGDDTQFGNLAVLLRSRLVSSGALAASQPLEVKTTDVRLSLPDVKVDEEAVQAVQLVVPGGQVLAAPIAAILSAFSKNKAASAVFCVAIDGRHFLGNDARLFRFGAEGELRDAVESAIQRLTAAVRSGATTESPACDPGWEGGQAQ